MTFEATRSGDGIATLTIDKPDRRNALGNDDWRRLGAHLAELVEDDDIRVVVVTGAGPFFSAGGDLKQFPADPRETYSLVLRSNRTVSALARFPKPTIAKVRGGAYGSGLSLAMACDLVVAAEGSVFCPAFMRRGLSPDLGSSYLLTRLLGRRLATELLFLGRDVPADEAHRLGLVTDVVPDADLDGAVDEFAARLAATSPLALRLTKKLIAAAEDDTLEAVLEREGLSLAVNALSGGAAGIDAFLDGVR